MRPAVLICCLCLLTTSSSSQSLFEGKRTWITCDSVDVESLHRLQQTVEQKGGHVLHVWPPRYVEAYLTPEADSELRKLPFVRSLTDKKLSAVGTRPHDNLILHTWNVQFSSSLVTRGDEPKGEQDHNSKRAPDLDQANTKFVLRGQKNFYLTSEYMMGTVAVGIVFVESNGKRDRKTESWTEEDKEDVLAQIHTGLDWWAETGGYKAGLTWTYEIHTLETPYEPINRTKDESPLWITECMENLGYQGAEEYTLNREFANDLRDKYKTDWAFIIYVVPSTHDEDGYFHDQSGIAWAYLGGPYMVISNKCNGWGFTQVWKVVAHETGHVFNALDEYKGVSHADDRSGRLNVQNGNHEDGGVINEACLMKNNEPSLCTFTSGQIGWFDADSNGSYDSDYLNIGSRFNRDRVLSEWDNWRSGATRRRKHNPQANILYAEDFRTPNGWYEDEYNYIRDGEYHIYDPAFGSSAWLEKPYSDFDVAVTTRWHTGSSVSGYGLMYRIFGPNDSYIFFINGDGQFCVGKYRYGNWEYLQDWARSSAIVLNGTNRLRVRAAGPQHVFFINDVEVARVQDETFGKGSIGFAVLPEVHVTFDDLVISKP